jgi:hypothetical protein
MYQIAVEMLNAPRTNRRVLVASLLTSSGIASTELDVKRAPTLWCSTVLAVKRLVADPPHCRGL